MKAIATVSMYDMGSAFRNGLNHSQTPEQRQSFIQSAIEQRQAEFNGAEKAYIPGTVNKLDDATPAIQREFLISIVQREAAIPRRARKRR
ncbi:Dienelactone hydrolase and related enzymes [Raoultella ornithinolytica]|nr:Dienelactone hydrolase and related enzymes [Raoultella ornithinolytica]